MILMFDQMLVFLNKLFFFIPRPYIVQVFEGAVFLRCGKHKTKFWFRKGKNRVMKSLEPGIYVLLPVIDDIRAITKVDQAVDLKNQSLLTRDGKNIVVSGTIRYHIDKPQKALLDVHDMDVTLSRVGLGVIADYVNTKTLAECTELAKLKAELMMKMFAIAKEWGIHIDEVYITDIGTTINLRLLTNTDNPNSVVF